MGVDERERERSRRGKESFLHPVLSDITSSFPTFFFLRASQLSMCLHAIKDLTQPLSLLESE